MNGPIPASAKYKQKQAQGGYGFSEQVCLVTRYWSRLKINSLPDISM